MKKSIAMKWCEALESGEYGQTKGKLRSKKGNTFCCLGVLCNMHAQAHPEFASKQLSKHSYDGEEGVLPESVQNWAGFKDNHGELPKNAVDKNGNWLGGLAEANDNGMKFPEIAKLIRKHYKEL